MKRFFLALTLVTVLGAASSAWAAAEKIDGIAAIVNDEAITLSELEAETKTVKAQLQQQQSAQPSDAVLQKQVLERLVLIHLKQQLASRNNIIIDDETLNRALSSIAKQNNMSLAQLRNIIERDGFDFNLYRENIRNEILHTRLRQRYVDNRINITSAEIDLFLKQQEKSGGSEDEYQLNHILISVPEGAGAETIQSAKQRAQSILDRLAKGEDFAQLAIAESDSQQALSGGDLGWRKLGEIPSLFANAVIEMNKGDVSPLIRNPSGFHIIKLNDKRGGERHMVNQSHARHILIKTNELIDDNAALHKIEELKSRIEQGDDFATLAKANSDDKGSAAKGGDLGWANPGQMVPAFEKVMDEVALNKVSEPFQSQFGWHILEVLERRTQDDTDQYRRNIARQQLFERKVSEEEELWLRQLRDEAYVEIRTQQGAEPTSAP